MSPAEDRAFGQAQFAFDQARSQYRYEHLPFIVKQADARGASMLVEEMASQWACENGIEDDYAENPEL